MASLGLHAFKSADWTEQTRLFGIMTETFHYVSLLPLKLRPFLRLCQNHICSMFELGGGRCGFLFEFLSEDFSDGFLSKTDPVWTDACWSRGDRRLLGDLLALSFSWFYQVAEERFAFGAPQVLGDGAASALSSAFGQHLFSRLESDPSWMFVSSTNPQFSSKLMTLYLLLALIFQSKFVEEFKWNKGWNFAW